MTPRRIIVVAVALTLGGACAAQAAYPAAKSRTIVLGTSIGGVSLGESLAKAKAAWGPGGSCTVTAGKGACEYLAPATSATIHPSWGAFGVTGGKVTIVFIYPPFNNATKSYLFTGPSTAFRTSAGIHIGSTAQAVRRAYPHAQPIAKYSQIAIKKGGVETLFSLVHSRVYSIAVELVTKKA